MGQTSDEIQPLTVAGAATSGEVTVDGHMVQGLDHHGRDHSHYARDHDGQTGDQASLQTDGTGHDLQPLAGVTDTADAGKTVVVIDSRVQNFEQLAQGVNSNAVLVIVGQGEGGLQDVSHALETTGPVSSIQIFAHGDPGDLTLGTDVLTAASVAGEHQTVLASWETHLTPNADILLYGCRTGEGTSGLTLIDSFAQVTKADVAASTDDTGSAAHGGNWNLEVSTGPIEAHIAIDPHVLDAYASLLTSAPTLDGLGSIVIQPDTTTAVIMAPGATASDVDFGTGSWNGGSLTIIRSTGASTQDVFSATGTLGTLTQGGSLTVDGTAIGTVTTNSSGRLVLSFDANSTTSLVNQAIDQIAYRNNNSNPPNLVTLNWTLSDGSNTTTTQAYVAVNDPVRNDAPVFTGLGNTISGVEDSATVLAPNVHVTDAELSSANGGLGNWSGATLQLDRSGTNNAADVFGATGPLSTLTEGGNLTVSGTTIGTITQNSAGQMLLTFNSNATNSLVETALQHITYTNTTNNPPASVTINWTMNDHNSGAQGSGGAGTITASTVVNLTGSPDAPTLGTINTATVTEQTAGQLASALVVSDPDSPSTWNGFTLDLSRQSGADSQDVFSGGGVLGTLTEGGSITISGQAIGTVTTNSGGHLVLTFDSNANGTELQTALRNIRYTNTADAPPSSVVMSWKLTDETGLSAPTVDQTVNITAVNDPSTVSGLGAVSATEQTSVTLAPTLSLNDPDGLSTTWNGGFVQIARQGGANAEDTYLVAGSAVTAGTNIPLTGGLATVTQNSGGTLKISFGTGVTGSDVEGLLRQIEYNNSSDAPTASLNLNWTIDDGPNSQVLTQAVSVAGVNDAPALASIGTVAATEQVAKQLASTLTVSDPDNPSTWNGFTLSLSRQGGADAQDTFSSSGQLGALTEGGAVTWAGTAIGTVTTNSGGQLVLSFDSNATGTDLRNAMRNIYYTNTSDAPPSSVNLDWHLSDQGGAATDAVQTVNITAVNDVASYSGIDATTATEQVTHVLAPSLSISDPDGLGSSYAGGFVQISRVGTGGAQDSYSIGGVALNNGDTISLGGGTASVTAGPTSTLKITFGAGVTGSDVQGLLRQIEYQNTSDTPPASVTLRWSLDDGPNATQTVDQTVSITAVDDAPSLGFTTNTVNATEQTSVRLNSALSVSDVDAPANWSGATLTLARQGGADAQDQFSNTSGQNTLPLVEGGSLTVGGTNIGTVTQNSAGQLGITFNASATTARVNDALQDISYTNTSDAPPAQAVLQWSLTDAGGAQGTATTTVNIAAINDVASYSGINATTATEQVAHVLAPSLSITDPDGLGASYAGGFVQIARQGGADAQDSFSLGGTALNSGDTIALTGGTASVTQGPAGTLNIAFGAGVTGTDVQGLLRQIEYHNTSDAPPASVTLAWSLNDGPNPTQMVNQSVSITAVDDAPVIAGLNNTVAATEQTAAQLAASATVSDPDLTTDWAGATLTIARQGGASAQDEFGNTGSLGTLTEGAAFTVGGTTVGTVTHNSGGDLHLTFNAGATTAQVQSAIQGLTYTNNSDAPPASATLDWHLTDPGGATASAVTTVNIAPVNDPFTLSGVDPVNAVQQTWAQLAPSFAVADPDGLTQSWTSGHLIVERQGGANAQDSFGTASTAFAQGSTIAFGDGGTASVTQSSAGTLRIDFGAGVTGTDVRDLVASLGYRNDSGSPPASVDLAWTLTDGTFSQTPLQTVSITAASTGQTGGGGGEGSSESATTGVSATETISTAPTGLTTTEAATTFTVLSPVQATPATQTAPLANAPTQSQTLAKDGPVSTGTSGHEVQSQTGSETSQPSPVLGVVQPGGTPADGGTPAQSGPAVGGAVLVFPTAAGIGTQAPSQSLGTTPVQTVEYVLPGQLLAGLEQAGGPVEAVLPGGAPLPAGVSYDQAAHVIVTTQPLTAPLNLVLTPRGGSMSAPQVQVWLLVQPLPAADAPVLQTAPGRPGGGIDQSAMDKAGMVNVQIPTTSTAATTGAGKVLAGQQTSFNEQLAQSGTQGLVKRARDIAASAASVAGTHT